MESIVTYLDTDDVFNNIYECRGFNPLVYFLLVSNLNMNLSKKTVLYITLR